MIKKTHNYNNYSHYKIIQNIEKVTTCQIHFVQVH
jgi:hypothetical protein